MKHSLKSGAGYLIIDHRDSPGIRPEDIPDKLKNTAIAVSKGQIYETDALNCTHCQRFVSLNPDRIRSRGYCPYCHHYICDSCQEMLSITGTCIPFKKVLDKAVNQVETGKSIILTDSD